MKAIVIPPDAKQEEKSKRIVWLVRGGKKVRMKLIPQEMFRAMDKGEPYFYRDGKEVVAIGIEGFSYREYKYKRVTGSKLTKKEEIRRLKNQIYNLKYQNRKLKGGE